jgi:hypothetical protein
MIVPIAQVEKRPSRGIPFETEQGMRGDDGKYCWFLIRYKPLNDASEPA